MVTEDRSSCLHLQSLEGPWMHLFPLVIKKGVLWRTSEEGARGTGWKGLFVAM